MSSRTFHTLSVNGTTLNVLVAGQGSPVLLIHGFPDDHTVWRHQIDALVAAGHQVIAPDTRGCGASALSPQVSDYHVDNLVADLIGVLDALGLDRVAVAGHDWGAGIGWMLTIQHPARVTRYAALSVGHPTAFVQAPLAQKLRSWYMLYFQFRGVAEWLARARDWALLRTALGHPSSIDEVIARLSRPGRLTAGMNYYRANVDMILARTLPRVQVPVLGVFSTGDRFLIESQMRESARYVDAAWRYARVDNASHWLQLDAPDRVNPLLLAFFATT